jgi:hypothetical protein
MHPKIPELAAHFGVKLSERSCEDGAVYDGRTIATNCKSGYLGDHRVMHEIAHYVVSKRRQKGKPEFNLGSVYNSWEGVKYLHTRKLPLSEGDTQEFMCQFLCVLWGRAYGISVVLPSEREGSWDVVDWDGYLRYKTQEFSHSDSYQQLQWRALIRLRARGMLNRLPIAA